MSALSVVLACNAMREHALRAALTQQRLAWILWCRHVVRGERIFDKYAVLPFEKRKVSVGLLGRLALHRFLLRSYFNGVDLRKEF